MPAFGFGFGDDSRGGDMYPGAGDGPLDEAFAFGVGDEFLDDGLDEGFALGVVEGAFVCGFDFGSGC